MTEQNTSSLRVGASRFSIAPLTRPILMKGSLGESRLANALREVQEETGYTCLPIPVTLDTRLCPAEEAPGVFTPDIVRLYDNAVEPFMMSVRDLSGLRKVEGEQEAKIIWWFVARVDETKEVAVVSDSEVSSVEVFGHEEAVEKCTFEKDKEILRRAIELVEKLPTRMS